MRISDWSSDVCSSDLWNRAFELAQGFDEARGVEDVQAAITALRALPELEGGVGVVGYCLGGKLAYLAATRTRSEEHTSELQSLMRISYAVFCLKKKKRKAYKVTTSRTKVNSY